MHTWASAVHTRLLERWPTHLPTRVEWQCRRCYRRAAAARRTLRVDDRDNPKAPQLRSLNYHPSPTSRRTITTYQPSKEIIDRRNKNSKYTGKFRRRGSGQEPIPLPPFLSDNATLKVKERQYREQREELWRIQDANHTEQEGFLDVSRVMRRTSAKESDNSRRAERRAEDAAYRYSGTFKGVGMPEMNLKKSMQATPFSTAFAQNPFAHALAAPVRIDTFSRTRQPLSCLLDFHLRSHGDPDNPKLSLQNLSIAAAQRSKRKPMVTLTDEEVYIEETWNSEVESFRPNGLCSYTSNKKDVMHYISEHPEKRVKKCVLTLRTMRTMEQERKSERHIEWRSDMPDFLLHSLRRVVCKKMRYLLANKAKADTKGIVQSPPGNVGLERLDVVDNVMCVLSLKPRPLGEAESEGEGHTFAAEDSSTVAGVNPTASSPSLNSTEQYPSFFEKVEEPDSNDTEQFNRETLADVAEETLLEAKDLPPVEDGLAPTPVPERMRKTSATHVTHEGNWVEKNYFLRNIKPLSPPAQPSLTYFPTTRYRNQRVPLYNLPHLLGEENVASLTKGTAFENSQIVTLTRSFSHLELQTWLLKLAGYIAANKADTPKI